MAKTSALSNSRSQFVLSKSGLRSLYELYLLFLVIFTLRVPAARQNRDGFSRAAHPQLLEVHMHDGRSQISALIAGKYNAFLCTDSRERFLLHSPHAAHELCVAPPPVCSGRSREGCQVRGFHAQLGYVNNQFVYTDINIPILTRLREYSD